MYTERIERLKYKDSNTVVLITTVRFNRKFEQSIKLWLDHVPKFGHILLHLSLLYDRFLTYSVGL